MLDKLLDQQKYETNGIKFLSWIFKLFSDAAATADARSAYKIAIFK